MRTRLTAILLVLAATVALAAQDAKTDRFAGVWSGTYDGVATGPFELILEKGKDAGTMTGKVNVTSDAGNYSAELKSVSLEGTKMTTK